MEAILTRGLSRVYTTYEKEPGLKGSWRNLFHRTCVKNRAVDGVDLSIGEGEIVGFLGANGAGKTTLLKMLAGLIHPTAGEARVLGFTPWERRRELLGQYALVMGMKSQVWVDLPAIETFNLCREIYQIERGRFTRTLGELAEVLDVGHLLKTQVRRLSLGERMKMELVAALLHEPKVLFLDEPTIGLDIASQGSIREFIRGHNRGHRTTVLLTSHYLRDIQELCGRVVVLHKGRVAFDGGLDEIRRRGCGERELTLAFGSPVTEAEAARMARVVRFDPLRVTLRMDRGDLPAVIAEALGAFDVVDLSAGDLPIEDVVASFLSACARDGGEGGAA
jgi:ABC-2 type transport system ATP-binding protein